MCLPAQVVVCRCDQQAAGALVSIGEGRGEANRCLLQPVPPQHLPAARTILWHRETEDLLLTVTKPNHTALHLILDLFFSTFNSSSSSNPPIAPELLLLTTKAPLSDLSSSVSSSSLPLCDTPGCLVSAYQMTSVSQPQPIRL